MMVACDGYVNLGWFPLLPAISQDACAAPRSALLVLHHGLHCWCLGELKGHLYAGIVEGGEGGQCVSVCLFVLCDAVSLVPNATL